MRDNWLLKGSLALLMVCALTACGNALSSLGLTEEVDFDGLSFAVNPAWPTETQTQLDGQPAEFEVSVGSSKITCETFLDGVADDLDSYGQHYNIIEGYELDKEWDADGITYHMYSSSDDYNNGTVKGERHIVFVLGGVPAGAGFYMRFNIFNEDEEDVLTPEMVSAIIESIQFDPSQVTGIHYDYSKNNSSIDYESLLAWLGSSDTSEDASSESSAAPDVSVSQQNALTKAKSYIKNLDFSYDGLVKQLEHNGFSHEDAIYAADNCGADWQQEAIDKANSYQEWAGFSRSGLIRQLVHDGFTEEQASNAADAIGLY